MDSLGSFARKLRDTGFFNIVGAGTLNKVLSFASGVILVRVVSKTDYGAYSYALNIINYFVLLNGIGTSSCVVQLCVERGEGGGAAERVYSLACAVGMLWDVLLTAVIVAFALFVPLPVEGSNRLLLFLAPFPLFSLAVDFQQQRLRSRMLNREYALASNVNSASLVAFSIGGALLGSAPGLSVGRTMAMAVSATATHALYGVRVYLRPKVKSRAVLADLLKMSLTVCVTNAVSQALLLVGTTLVGSVTGSQSMVATYSTAATIPFALDFIPGMAMTYAAPYFIRRNRDREWTIRRWGQLSLAMLAGAGVVSVVAVATADWVVPLVFGSQYSDAVPAFRVLMVAFAVGATFRKVSGNVVAFHRRYLFNLVSSAVSLASAGVLTLALVPGLGAVGAALGYLAAMCVGGIVNVVGLVALAGHPLEAPDN